MIDRRDQFCGLDRVALNDEAYSGADLQGFRSVVMPPLESPVTVIEAFDGHRGDSPQKLGSRRTHRWREMDSNF